MALSKILQVDQPTKKKKKKKNLQKTQLASRVLFSVIHVLLK